MGFTQKIPPGYFGITRVSEPWCDVAEAEKPSTSPAHVFQFVPHSFTCSPASLGAASTLQPLVKLVAGVERQNK